MSETTFEQIRYDVPVAGVARVTLTRPEPRLMTGGYLQPGQAGAMANEEEFYLGMCWRWRNLPKPTIAQVHGKVIAGGLMLVWPCDIVVASEDATLSDPMVAFGV